MTPLVFSFFVCYVFSFLCISYSVCVCSSLEYCIGFSSFLFYVLFYVCNLYASLYFVYDSIRNIIGRVSYLIYVSMRHYVLTSSGDIVVCFHTAVYLSC